MWGDLDPDEDEQRLSGEVEVGKRIEKKREEKSKGKANDVLKKDQGSSDEEDKEGASLATIVLLLTSSFQ